jgi:hypothetical protein
VALRDKIHEWVRANVKNGDVFLKRKLKEQQKEIEQQRRMDQQESNQYE